ncbi:MAG: GTPase HflX, partial [Deltaproteobacteria bacterium]|nr:GTPase HflX [Deltaproteobacteria bacterium]
GRTYQRNSKRGKAVHPATFVGRGKAEHVADLADAHQANVVVFDNELSPAQIRELERIIKVKVLDRSELILDIFASRARTREAKLQVELAQLEYTAPRLRGMWTHLERQAGTTGPLGMRGPGEKQIEIDRRLVGRRIARLKRELTGIHGRKEREVEGRTTRHFCVGLVGYTNAGKSTLMNALTKADTYAADQLFATLDTKTRMWSPAPGIEVMLSDTVGFVRNLPHYLVASFRTTLEEAVSADLLLHVVDASHVESLDQVDTVDLVLEEIGCDTGNMVAVLNKADAVGDHSFLEELRARLPQTIVVSALTGEGLDQLAELVASEVRRSGATMRIEASAGAGKLIAFVHSRTEVHSESYDRGNWSAEVTVARPLIGRLRQLASADSAELIEL